MAGRPTGGRSCCTMLIPIWRDSFSSSFFVSFDIFFASFLGVCTYIKNVSKDFTKKRNFKNEEFFLMICQRIWIRYWKLSGDSDPRAKWDTKHLTHGQHRRAVIFSVLLWWFTKKRAGSESAMVQIFSGTVCKKWLFLLYLFLQGTATQKAAHPLLFFYREERCSASLVYTKERWCRDDYIYWLLRTDKSGGFPKENRLDVSMRHRFSSSAPDGNDRVAGL